MMVQLPDVFSSKYGLDEAKTGLCFLPIGFGALLGSPIGGRLGDLASAKLKSSAGVLLVSDLTLVLMIPTLIANGWYMQEAGPLAGLLVLNAVAGFCFCFSMPGIQNYAVTVLPSQAGVALGLVQLVMFVFAGIMIWASTELVLLMGLGWMFTMLALIQVPTAAAVIGLTVTRMKADSVQL
jgi:MFS family permease